MDRFYFWISIMFYYIQFTDCECALRDATIYVRSEGYHLLEEAQAVIEQVTLSECADRCTSNVEGINCTSFEYDAVQMKCALKASAGRIMDNTILMTNNDNTALFQQLCIQETHICPSPYAFERLPGQIMMGIAREVIKANTLEDCLGMCLAAKRKMNMECRSAMYYYDTSECILNGENRVTSTALITNDTLSMRVDYFENNCFDITCSNDSALHWIKVQNFAISDKRDILMEHVTKEQCISFCSNNKFNNQPFPCKLYAYSETEMTCHLTSESGLTNSVTMPSLGRENFEYFEKICLRGSVRCQDNSFEHVANHILSNIIKKVLTTSSMASCLEMCLNSGNQCNAVMFIRDKDECILSEKTQYTDPKQFQYFPEVDYFDNVCDYTMSPQSRINPMMTDEQPQDINGVLPNKAKSLTIANKVDSRITVEHDFMDNSEMEPVHEKLETECGLDEITVTIHFAKPTIGAIFIKDHFATCRNEFNSTVNATMEIALSSLRHDNPPCPGYEINPSMWSFVIVVQKNGLGVPALMTDADRIFNISCDYSNAYISSISDRDMLVLREASSQNTLSTLASQNYVRLAVLRDGQPVSSAVMGEELELRWTVVEEYANNVGLFLNRCIAERLDGIDPQPSPLTLIADGCISDKVNRLLMRHPIMEFDGGLSTRIKVFRFDGSRRVRILCSVDICIERCIPANCNKKANNNSTNSDKKKRQVVDYLIYQDQDERVKRQLITGTFTVVEKSEKMQSNGISANIDDEQSSFNHNKMIPFQLAEDDQICIQQTVIFLLIALIITLSTTQIYVLYKYVRIRNQHSASTESDVSYSTISTPQRIYFGREECFCSPKARMTLSRISRLQNAGVTGGGRVLVA